MQKFKSQNKENFPQTTQLDICKSDKQTLHKEYIQMANEHRKRCSVSYGIRKLKQ